MISTNPTEPQRLITITDPISPTEPRTNITKGAKHMEPKNKQTIKLSCDNELKHSTYKFKVGVGEAQLVHKPTTKVNAYNVRSFFNCLLHSFLFILICTCVCVYTTRSPLLELTAQAENLGFFPSQTQTQR